MVSAEIDRTKASDGLPEHKCEIIKVVPQTPALVFPTTSTSAAPAAMIDAENTVWCGVKRASKNLSRLRMELFSEARTHWISPHRQLFCQHDRDTVVLFRACCQHLGPHAAGTGSFRGSRCYEKDRTRMMWFDTSFLVAMRKSAWGTIPGREVVLAIWVRRSFLEDCVATAVCSTTLTTFGGTEGAVAANKSGARRCRRLGSGPIVRPSSERVSRPGFSRDALARSLAAGRRALNAADGDDQVDRDGDVEVQGRGRSTTSVLEEQRGAVSDIGNPESFLGEAWRRSEGEATRPSRSRALSEGYTPPSNGRWRMMDGVRVHWEPERLPSGEKHRTRRVVQLGLKGTWLHALGSGKEIMRIERLDGLMAEQRRVLASSEPQALMVPVARPLDVGHLESAQLEELLLVSGRARPKLRILCLHGYLQNSQVFSQRTRQLCKKLRPTAELVYVDAPHSLSPEELLPLPVLSSPREEEAIAAVAAAAKAAAKLAVTGEGGVPEVETKTGKTDWSPPDARTATGSCDGDRVALSRKQHREMIQQDRQDARAWWRCDPEERQRAKEVKGMAGRCELNGLEESLAFLRRVWDEQGPFDGLLGFSQGAAMASIFHHCAFSRAGKATEETAGSSISEHGNLQIPGYPLGQEEAQENLPTLHVWAIDDCFVPASQSQRLAAMYKRAAVFIHRGSHCVPQTRDVVPSFTRFLEKFR